MRLSHGENFWEARLYPWFGFRPCRCLACGDRSVRFALFSKPSLRRKKRRVRHRRRRPEEAEFPAEDRSRLEHQTLVAQLRRAEDESQPPAGKVREARLVEHNESDDF